MIDNIQNILPAFGERNIPIVLASSAYYVPFMSVTIQSIISNSSAENNYDFLLLHKEIPEETQKAVIKMADGYQNISVRFFKLSDELSKYRFNFRQDVAAASESFYCVMLQEIFPAYDKVICLDCDVVVCNDLAQLFSYDINQYMIAAARDPDGIGNTYAEAAGRNCVKVMQGRDTYMMYTLKLKKIEDYFQSGVMLLNLSKWRQKYTVDEIVQVACADWIVWGDQDTMNYLCAGDVLYLPLSWNVVINQKGKQIGPLVKYGPKTILAEYLSAREAPNIIHYAGTKPWNESLVDFFPYFWRYAMLTPFYGEIVRRAELSAEHKKKLGEPLEATWEEFKNGHAGLRWVFRYFIAWLKYKFTKKSIG